MDKHTVGQPSPVIQDEMRRAQNGAQAPQQQGQHPSGGTHANAAPAPAQRDWFDRVLQQAAQPHSDKSAVVTITQSFINAIEQQAQQVQAEAFKLSGPISQHEWDHARSTQPAVIDKWFYEDVGVFVAPGGTGKTTLLLFQVIHLVLGLELFGYEVINPGTVIILTAEDSREAAEPTPDVARAAAAPEAVPAAALAASAAAVGEIDEESVPTEAHAEPAPVDLPAPGFAEAVVVEDASSGGSGICPAMVIDLARGKRISIFAAASPAVVAAALKALR